jgi:hypothetical protein
MGNSDLDSLSKIIILFFSYKNYKINYFLFSL